MTLSEMFFFGKITRSAESTQLWERSSEPLILHIDKKFSGPLCSQNALFLLKIEGGPSVQTNQYQAKNL